eukprot:scaffold2024_cov63-Phaeocystis_antarctica.AAC.2
MSRSAETWSGASSSAASSSSAAAATTAAAAPAAPKVPPAARGPPRQVTRTSASSWSFIPCSRLFSARLKTAGRQSASSLGSSSCRWQRSSRQSSAHSMPPPVLPSSSRTTRLVTLTCSREQPRGEAVRAASGGVGRSGGGAGRHGVQEVQRCRGAEAGGPAGFGASSRSTSAGGAGAALLAVCATPATLASNTSTTPSRLTTSGCASRLPSCFCRHGSRTSSRPMVADLIANGRPHPAVASGNSDSP